MDSDRKIPRLTWKCHRTMGRGTWLDSDQTVSPSLLQWEEQVVLSFVVLREYQDVDAKGKSDFIQMLYVNI